MVTIRDVAKAAGVSLTSVSHVINHTRVVSEDIQERVRKAIEETGYRANVLARSLRRGQTHTLGLVLPDSSNPFFAETGREIEQAAFQAGYSVILCNTENDVAKERLYVNVLVGKQVDGLIFVATGDESDSLTSLLGMGIPVVAVDRDLPHGMLDTVLSDNRGGARSAVQHLLDLGHVRIGCIAGPRDLATSVERLEGYRQALDEAGLRRNEFLERTGDFRAKSGLACARELLALPARPTAIFACNDLMAMGVLRAAAELDLRVPEDLAVVGFDDIELASYTMPSLTTVAQPKAEIGRTAVALLLDRIDVKDRPARRQMLPTSLLIRKSSGALGAR
jgi:LacI family transcriptional regulator